MYSDIIDSPVGRLTITAEDEYLCGIAFGETSIPHPNRLTAVAAVQIREYFDGRRVSFDIPLAAPKTEFYGRVRQGMLSVPYGNTATYGEIAAFCGNEKASRAVGQACNKNPFAIIVPCHRIVGAGGKLTGYAGGLDRKTYLLRFEKEHFSEQK